MVSKVFEGTNVEIPAVLANRDRRVATQAQLLREHPSQVVVACKLNIPGPVKNSAAIQAFFTAGLARLEDQWLACGQPFEIATSWEDAPTGPERFYLLYSAGVTVKEGTVHFEERQPANRLFDLDVLITNGGESHSLSRGNFDLPVQICLICGRPAKECGRSRRHSVEEL
ncbi:citrate lyase holo-[acyl-carrier protein] synthase [Limosilactobacillus fermentum]|uniref:citrate lyase holo-[acyl-carrier protein] synthase n=1 Tax=Limosilactobacillus fermentum TaxID=1613 RepID=UPI00288A0149|nr:citrate lyase holo-[acyl-carrier protein] synthase [Limosilactobacillus fermentum]